MARVWLHVGMMKTGTTALQEWCAAHEGRLAQAGLFYLRDRNRAACGRLVDALARGPAGAAALDALAQRIADAAAPEVLVSAESLVARGPDFLRPWIARLPGHELRIVLRLRRQDRYAEASYKQLVKWSGTAPPIAAFLAGLAPQLDYHRVLAGWQAAFPQARLHPQIHDEAGADSIADMLRTLGRADLVPEDSAGFRRNLTPAAALVARYGQIGPGQAQALRRANRRIMREFGARASGRGDLIAPDMAAALRTRFAASNEQVRARWFPERAQLFADDTVPAPAEAPATEAALARLAELLAGSGDG